jgi:hypothetical protein
VDATGGWNRSPDDRSRQHLSLKNDLARGGATALAPIANPFDL